MADKPVVERRDEHGDEHGDRIATIHAYAPGDGYLSFVARDPHTSKAVHPGPSREECAQALPDGWELYADGFNWRARKIIKAVSAGLDDTPEGMIQRAQRFIHG